MLDDVRRSPPLDDWPFTSYAVLGGVLALCDLLFVPVAWVTALVSQSPTWAVYLGIGLFLAHVAVLPIWLVWTSGPYWRRLLRHWLAIAGLAFLFFVGLFTMELFHSDRAPAASLWAGYAFALCCLPAVSLGAELPLWIARYLFGWRMVPATHLRAADQRLSLADGVAGLVAAVAGGLSFGLLLLVDPGPSDVSVLGLSSLPAVAAVVSLLAVIPIGWSILGAEDVALTFGLLVIAAAFAWRALASTGEFFALRLPADDGSAFPLSMTFLLAVISALALARRDGFRLGRGKGG